MNNERVEHLATMLRSCPTDGPLAYLFDIGVTDRDLHHVRHHCDEGDAHDFDVIFALADAPYEERVTALQRSAA